MRKGISLSASRQVEVAEFELPDGYQASGMVVALSGIMRSAWLMMLVLAASCDNISLPSVSAMPWVRGFQATAASDVPTLAAARRISALRTTDEHGAIELRADVAGDSRLETVLVSYPAGTVVLDPAGRMLASAPGFEYSGSADDLISVAVGDGQLRAPLILVAIQTGGHRESTILLAVYRVHPGKNLEQVFLAPIEEHDGMETAVGSLTFVPSGIIYRAPRSPTASLWTFDMQRQRYIEQGRIEPNAALPST